MADRKYTRGSWTLADLIAADKGPEMDSAISRVEEAVAVLEERRGELDATIPEGAFTEILGLVDHANYAIQRIHGYAILRAVEDANDQDVLALQGRVHGVVAEARSRIAFFDLWWQGLDADNVARLLAAAGGLAFHLEDLRAFTPFQLSEGEERVVRVKDVNGFDALNVLYAMITESLAYPVEIDCESKDLSRSEVRSYMRDPSPEKREEACRVFLGAHEARAGELAQIYKHIAADWHAENVGLRGMPSSISARNVRNSVPDEAVELLLEACRRNAVLYQRFFRLKARILGLPKLRRSDLYAPLADAEAEYGFDEGVKIVLECFRGFAPQFAELAERVISEKHLDSLPRHGRYSSAACAPILPDRTPWVLVNYEGKARDVSTLAHELAHAVHSMLSAEHSVLTFDSSLPLAETASAFAEMLVLETMLEKSSAPAERQALLAAYIDDSYMTIPRQAFFTLFEQDAHRMIADGEGTLDQLNAAYLANLREQFGDSLSDIEPFRLEWLSISQLYNSPFYCYAYAFGLLLVLSLFQRYKIEGDAFVPKYLRILAYGGSKSTEDILAEACFDILAPEFWQRGFDVLAGMVDELEGLC